MSQPNKDINQTIDAQIKRARVEQLEREAMEQGIKPFDADEWKTDADLWEDEEEFEEFLSTLREWRKEPYKERML